ncbi:DUF742 domain-containing protein [Streptomyces sp. DSM 44917]|uniref:DUF742 domain-containing protein n=1 Tax=Streptomyces boetiae TaxID=3075541 RepID=A0ABU2L9L2_9ACTN|nr:DUF742 domain-containing protein [Streptomyces sp. DSM 44917]MDT0308244.1 DUF742 domain-containing protein [Streptomyces sp. DSM 44917]
MATPPGGPYGNEYPPQPHSGHTGRFNFPSAPSNGRQDYADRSGLGLPGPPGPPGHGQEYPHVPHDAGQGVPHHQQQSHGQGPQQPAPARRPGEGEQPQPLVRPYAMTGGRTKPRYQLAIEALVSTTADPVHLTGQLPEHQRICQLCYEVKSVAEVSALLTIPLGVARILVADLAEAGLVAIHQPGHEGEPGGQPDVTLLERVLSGLRKL